MERGFKIIIVGPRLLPHKNTANRAKREQTEIQRPRTNVTSNSERHRRKEPLGTTEKSERIYKRRTKMML